MTDALVVLNAGSSSIKFSLYAIDGATLAIEVRGQIEGLTEKPQFVARDAAGIVVGQHVWAASALDHACATAYRTRSRALSDCCCRPSCRPRRRAIRAAGAHPRPRSGRA